MKNWLYILTLSGFFLLAFLLRVNQIGGLKPNLYRFNSVTFEQPDSYSVKARQNLSYIINQLLPSPQAELLSGIVLGQKSDIPKDLKNALITTSTVHIVVVSGQNLSLLAGFIFAFLPVLGRKKTIILSTVVIWAFSALTGFQLPVLRAAIMVQLSFLAQALGKDKESYWILIITAAIMILFDPNWLFSVSFQLSFLATAGVIVLSPLILNRLNFLPEIIKQDLSVSLSAQLLTAPVIALNFQMISLVGLITNTLILWTIGPIMISGISILVLGILSLPLGQILAIVPSVLLTYFIDIVNFFAGLNFASLTLGKTSMEIWIGYYLLIFGFFVYLKKSSPRGLDPQIVLN